MRLNPIVTCLLILNCLSSFANSTALAQQGEKDLRYVAPAETSTVGSDVIAVVTAFTDAMLSGRIEDAAALVDSTLKSGLPQQLLSARERMNAHSIRFRVVVASEDNGLALAVSHGVKVSLSHPELGNYAPFFVALKRSDQNWLVTRYGLWTHLDAEISIDQFLQASADAKTIPLIEAVATEAKNVESGVLRRDLSAATQISGGGGSRLDNWSTLASPRGALRSDLSAATQISGGGGSRLDNSSTLASPRVDVESLKLKAEQVEELTAKIAHDMNAASGKSRDVLRSRLRREVQSSFETRQQLQRAELKNVREQLKRIEQSIETRERIKDEIIDHRVEELLNPDLRWTALSHTDAVGTTGQAAEPYEIGSETTKASAQRSDTVRERKSLWARYGVTSAPVSDLTATVLEWIGLHLSPITNERFRDKNVFASYKGGLDVTFVRSDDGPAGRAGIHEVDIVVGLQGHKLVNLEQLDVAVKDAVTQIEQGDANSLQFDVLRNGETVRVNVRIPAKLFTSAATQSALSSGTVRATTSDSGKVTELGGQATASDSGEVTELGGQREAVNDVRRAIERN